MANGLASAPIEYFDDLLLAQATSEWKKVAIIIGKALGLSSSPYLQVGDMALQAYAASVQQRVQALARTHMLLAENGWQNVSLDKIVRTQVGVFDRDNVVATGPEVMIPAPSVQPIGLALHELVANAAVHGALAHPGGHLKISWRREGDGLALDWEESGLTLSPKQHGRGFGTVLLGAVLEKQLGGTITRDWRADGLSLRIALPALNRVGGGLRAKP